MDRTDRAIVTGDLIYVCGFRLVYRNRRDRLRTWSIYCCVLYNKHELLQFEIRCNIHVNKMLQLINERNLNLKLFEQMKIEDDIRH